MLRNISLVLSALIFVGCSTTNENIKKPQTSELKEVDTSKAKELIAEIVNDINSVPMSRVKTNTQTTSKDTNEVTKKAEVIEPLAETIEKKKIVKFSFNGEWIGSKTSKFLQRKIKLNQVNDSYARGQLILSYLNTSGVETVTDEFKLEVFLNDFDIEGFIKDPKTSKIEKIKILRDSKNEFRIISDENTIFFEGASMMFKKDEFIKNDSKDLQLSKIKEYFKNQNNTVIDSKNDIVWQDTNSAMYLKTNYENAKFYCEGLGDGWSLPSRNHIKDTYSIVDNKIDKAFKNGINSSYWTNEESIDDVLKAWSFDYQSGKEKIVNKDMKLNIRCVKANK